MEFALFAVIAIVTIVGATAFGARLGVAAPLLLVIVGIGYSYLPGAPAIRVEPDWILLGVLPPLLYAAAITVPVVDFRRNLNSISALSVGLVIVSSLVTGFVLFAILPNLALAPAIALGAVISPTDVVAATAIAKRIGLPPRLLAILEGEGLINDATALVLLRTAVAAIALSSSTQFSVWPAIGDFFYAAIVAAVVGLIIGWATVRVRGLLKDPVLDTAISFAVPFIAFIPAEELHASGVIAVVAAGLYSGHNAAKRFTPQVRISERINWHTLQFILENSVFLLMGAQLRGIIDGVSQSKEPINLVDAVLIGILAAAILIVLRFLFVGPLLLIIRRQGARTERQHQRWGARVEAFMRIPISDNRTQKRQERVQEIYERRGNDIAQLRSEGLGWRGGVVLSWTGMRGVVTLAAAQTLPEGIAYRPQLILIAFTVAVVTLLLQGGTLPFVIKLLGIRGSDPVEDRRTLATLLDEIGQAGLAVLDEPELELLAGKAYDPATVERVRHDTLISAEATWERAELGDDAAGIASSPHQQYRSLRKEVLRAERDALLAARSRGDYPSRILSRAETFLDLEETRIQQIDDHG